MSGTSTWTYSSPNGTGTIVTPQVMDLSGQYVMQDLYRTSTQFIANWTVFAASLDIAQGVLQANGTNWNLGTISFGPLVHLGAGLITVGADLVNCGTIDFSQSVDGEIKGHAGATLTNDGLVDGIALTIDPSVSGVGTIRFLPSYISELDGTRPGEIQFDNGVAAGQTVVMANDSTLILDDPRGFHATIDGFTGLQKDAALGNILTQDTLQILGLDISRTTYSGNAEQGSLTLFSGCCREGSIHFLGDYTHARFTSTSSGSDSLIHLASA